MEKKDFFYEMEYKFNKILSAKINGIPYVHPNPPNLCSAKNQLHGIWKNKNNFQPIDPILRFEVT
jgi:hypothetical protein